MKRIIQWLLSKMFPFPNINPTIRLISISINKNTEDMKSNL